MNKEKHNENRYSLFCAGCGLCHSAAQVEFQPDEKGFLYPVAMDRHQIALCDQVCPFGSNGIMESAHVWGDYRMVCRAWTADASDRLAASSGGVLTAAAKYLLETGKVDAVIQSKADPDDLYAAKTVCSATPQEVQACAGSRYTQTNPLMDILQLLEEGKTYAFIGKPCDVTALRNYMKLAPRLEEQIPYLLSFFCAGTPSRAAHDQILAAMGCEKQSLTGLSYRGNGWPGSFTATAADGRQYTMSYEESWMKYLGRDIRRSCKFCFDGIGEQADISAGDLWYLTPDRKPDFSEHDGVNIVFGRTRRGEALLREMADARKLGCEAVDLEQLKYCQPNHFNKRTTALAKMIGLKVTGYRCPGFSTRAMLKKVKYISVRKHLGSFYGTLKRARRGQI